MKPSARTLLPIIALTVAAASATTAGPVSAAAADSSHYDHVFVLVEENNGFSDIIGNSAAPNFNRLADTYGLATDYYGVSHPSEPNYVAMLGGSTFGIADDNPYWTHTVQAPSLITQLDKAGIEWKAYLQSSPHAGYQGMCYPAKCDGAPDSDPAYAAKHNGIPVFAGDRTAADWARQVPYTRLGTDLAAGQVPAFGYIIPDECHDMHGDPPFCLDSGTTFDAQNQHLVSVGDRFLGQTVAAITAAPFWARGNNAIVVTYDEGDDDTHGGGKVATVVITSHGPRSAQSSTFYNHYSLLATLEQNYGVPCLAGACDSSVKTMAPLFKVTGSAAHSYQPLTDPAIPTPTPLVAEPVSQTGITATSGGWTAISSPQYGTNNNALGAIASDGPNNVWAAGDFLPDTPDSNQDATLPLTEHYDGTSWNVVPTPSAGSNYAELYGISVRGSDAWTVGTDLDAGYRTAGLLEFWNGSAWRAVTVPEPGSERNLFYGVDAVAANDIWVVGTQQDSDGVYRTLTEHFDGTSWTVVPSADPGSSGDTFYAVTAVSGNDVYAVGQQLGAGAASDHALVEHWNGSSWSVVKLPALDGSTALLSVSVSAGKIYAVGESADPANGMVPVALVQSCGTWAYAHLPAYSSKWTYLLGVASSGGKAVAVGTDFDTASGNQVPVLLTGTSSGAWSAVNGPNPSSGQGGDIIGGITFTGGSLWATGMFDTGNNHMALLQHD